MKKIILFTIGISLTTFLHAQQPFSKVQLEIQQTVVNMFQSLSNRDSVSLKSYCTTDISLYEYGQIWNLDTLVKKAITTNQSADFKRTNTFDFIETKSDKSTAWVTYRLTSVVMKDAKETVIEWLETVILKRYEKQWKVNHLHSTLIKRS